MERIEQQAAFAVEIDKVKNIFRQTWLADGSRKENDAEHAWHAALMAVLLAEYSNEPIDILKVVKMLLLHDLVEIDAGDSYAYDEAAQATAHEREQKAADRIFGMLPKDQRQEFRGLWDEFEEYETPEAKFAHVMDNFQPLLLNDAADGKGWKEHQVKRANIEKRNRKTSKGSKRINEYIEQIIDRNIEKGNIEP
ncbi:MAG: HD domain-containing protein [Lachnospiraceae bacterium]|nr:HD domain-containing protein [Lachnospiraceae bacterium]MDY4771594.1 HD domain-containing protein [Lachnospiraceae bacterium]